MTTSSPWVPKAAFQFRLGSTKSERLPGADPSNNRTGAVGRRCPMPTDYLRLSLGSGCA
jgi:hypothetical protein